MLTQSFIYEWSTKKQQQRRQQELLLKVKELIKSKIFANYNQSLINVIIIIDRSNESNLIKKKIWLLQKKQSSSLSSSSKNWNDGDVIDSYYKNKKTKHLSALQQVFFSFSKFIYGFFKSSNSWKEKRFFHYEINRINDLDKPERTAECHWFIDDDNH